MPNGYDSKAAIIKTTDEDGHACYKLVWNVGNIILSVLTEDQFAELIRQAQRMQATPGWRGTAYRFPTMRHDILD